MKPKITQGLRLKMKLKIKVIKADDGKRCFEQAQNRAMLAGWLQTSAPGYAPPFVINRA